MWGSKLKFLTKLAEEAVTEEDVPQSLRNRPKLSQFQTPFWKMYKEITGSRQFTQGGPTEIPYPCKVLWLNENAIDDPDERRDYMQIVSSLDGTYLENYYEKNKVA